MWGVLLTSVSESWKDSPNSFGSRRARPNRPHKTAAIPSYLATLEVMDVITSAAFWKAAS